MASVDLLVCPEDCTSSLPVFEFSECAPILAQAQVSDIYLANDDNPLTNWEDLNEWLSRIDNDSLSASAIRALTVIGSMPAPEVTEKIISHQRTVYSPQTFNQTGRIDDNSDTNYDAARATGCNRQYRFWFATLGGYLYNGNTGELANLRMWEEIVEDENEYATLNYQLKWKSRFMPLRIPNPMAA